MIDLATLFPWDQGTVHASVAKTGRLVVVEEAPLSGGWGSEIVASIVRTSYSRLAAAPFRITAPDAPVPYGKELEALYCPWPDYIRRQLSSYLTTGVPPLHWWEDNATNGIRDVNVN